MLRKAVAIFLILTMSFQSLYKLGLVTWFEVNREYVATVLCINKARPELHCDGQCYLKKKMNDAEDQTPLQAESGRERMEMQFFVIEDFHFTSKLTPFSVNPSTDYLRRNTHAFTGTLFRPPSLG